MKTETLIRSVVFVALTTLGAGLVWPSTASAQLGAAGPFGPFQNYSYYGGLGPYGWGSYSYGWGGQSNVGYRPPMPPITEMPDYRPNLATIQSSRPTTAADALRQQADAAAWRDRQREALKMQTKVDVSTGVPRTIPTRIAPPLPLDRRIEILFEANGTLKWPAGLASASPVTRRAVEQAALAAFEEYQLQGRANVADVAFAREQLAAFSSPIFAQLAATDDPLAFQATFDFFQRLDTTLIDLADPPAEADPAQAPPADDAPAEPRGPRPPSDS